MNSRYEKDLKECLLCEHKCGIDRLAGEMGVCRVTGPVVASRALHPAPPESYTVFMAGCNMKCLNCQNWSISQYPDNKAPVEGHIEPEVLAAESIAQMNSAYGRIMGADRIFFSGGEAAIHLPYIEEVVESARQVDPDYRVNIDTNGYMTEQSLARIIDLATSITFDIKAFNDGVHRALTGVPVAPVLRNAGILAHEAPEKLWEFRVLVIPYINEDDIVSLCRFISELSDDLPVCFLAFRPNFALEGYPGASTEFMERCLDHARKAGLKNAAWSGAPDMAGRVRQPAPELKKQYGRNGSLLAASYASEKGCVTHPRNCSVCEIMHSCPVKCFIPERRS